MSLKQVDNEKDIAWQSRYKKRLIILLGVFIFWGLLIVIQLYQFMVSDREDYIKEANSISVRTGVLPACRGRLLDADGVLLAWSEREFCLQYKIAPSVEKVWEDLYALEQAYGGKARQYYSLCSNGRGRFAYLKRSLSADEILDYQDFIKANPAFRITSHFSRHYVNQSLRSKLGETHSSGQRQVGISGFEKKYNRELKGQDGRYRVNLDKRGDWVEGSWEELSPPKSGYDVYLPFTVSANH